MKTVLFVNSSGARYYRRVNRTWLPIEKPEHSDRLWVIANLPEETLEAFKLPMLFGRDRSHFLERHLANAFPRSQYRAAPVVSGGLFKPGTAVLTGLTTAEGITGKLEAIDIPIAGVWGVSMLLALMANRLALRNIVLAMPSVHYLRILVLKEGIPVLTRCIHRYSEDNNDENNSDAGEIQRTCQHLENRRIFEHGAIPPILYLGDSALTGTHLSEAGFTLLDLPNALSPRGEAAYLHPLFEYVVASPHGQLAPLQLRARHLAENLRRAAYAGIAVSLLAFILFGQEDFRALIDLHAREQTLFSDLHAAQSEHDELAGRIAAAGVDPSLVRQATKFSAHEMDAAPVPEALLQFTASAIADLPQVRIKTLSYRFPPSGDRYCQGHSVIELPLINRKFDLPLGTGSTPDSDESDAPQRYTELQFSIVLTENLAPAAQAEIRKRISAALKAKEGVQLMDDPAAFSLINTLKGGFGMDTTQAENIWCMSLPWQLTERKELP